MAFLSLDRSDRVFDNFLDVQTQDVSSSGEFNADKRREAVSKIRRHRRAKRAACDDAYELYVDAKEEGFRGSFLDFLIQNADTIMALVLKIMKLFGL